MKSLYNKSDKQSVLNFAKKLRNKSLRDVCTSAILKHTYSGKGNFGQILEKYYFQYKPNSESDADFQEIGLELKSSPLKKLKNNVFRSKERLVLNIINYNEVINQEFKTSSFWKKNNNILLVFYLHEDKQNLLDYIVKLVDEWNFPDNDLEIIKRDWETIKRKIVEGKAHELSEGDTFYLGACTKGGKGGNLRRQPNNPSLAKQRAYSLKQGYVNHIVASIANDVEGVYGKLINSSAEVKRKSIEEIVLSKFQPYYGLTVENIVLALGVKLNRNAKNFYASLTKVILGIDIDKEVEEFEKAEIIVKTVRLQENELPKEDMSFPAFKFEELIKEEWETSEFKEILEHKFLFVFFQILNDGLILKKAKFWNMPYEDTLKAKNVWERTKAIVASGNIVEKIVNKRRFTNFPNKKFSDVSHVRPHAQNSNDTYPLPIIDNATKLKKYTKHCFWLNSTYIRDKIYHS